MTARPFILVALLGLAASDTASAADEIGPLVPDATLRSFPEAYYETVRDWVYEGVGATKAAEPRE